MKNTELLYNNIEETCHKKNNNPIKEKLIFKWEIFDQHCIYSLLEHIKWKGIHNNTTTLYIDLRCRTISDDSTIRVFEIIMYDVVLYRKFNIKFNFINHRTLLNDVLYVNSLLSNFNNKILDDSYLTAFIKPTITLNQYRRLCKNDERNKSNEYLSKITNDIYMMLKNDSFQENFAEEFSEVCSEIINNAFEHTDGDCLVSILFCDSKFKRNYKKIVYLSCISLTKTFIETKLKEVIIKKKFNRIPGGIIVKRAFVKHKKMFNEKYDVDDFAHISAFQKYVSTRKNSIGTGGTGLTTLIKSLQVKTFVERSYSYVLSGNKTLYFKNEFLKFAPDGTIGFNDASSYFDSIPSLQTYAKGNRIFPGTIYNIGLLMEKELSNE